MCLEQHDSVQRCYLYILYTKYVYFVKYTKMYILQVIDILGFRKKNWRDAKINQNMSQKNTDPSYVMWQLILANIWTVCALALKGLHALTSRDIWSNTSEQVMYAWIWFKVQAKTMVKKSLTNYLWRKLKMNLCFIGQALLQLSPSLPQSAKNR